MFCCIYFNLHAYPSLQQIEAELGKFDKNVSSDSYTYNQERSYPSFNQGTSHQTNNNINYIFNLSDHDIILNFYIDSPIFGQQIIDSIIVPQPEKKGFQHNLMANILPNTIPIDMHFDSCNLIIIYALLPHSEIINKVIDPCYIQITPNLKGPNDFKIIIEKNQIIVTRMNTIRAIQIPNSLAHDLIRWPAISQPTDIDALKIKINGIKEDIIAIHTQEIPMLKKEKEALEKKLPAINKSIKNLSKQWFVGSQLTDKENEKNILEQQIQAKDLLIKYRMEHYAYYNQQLIQLEKQMKEEGLHAEKNKINQQNQKREELKNKAFQYQQASQAIFDELENNPYLKNKTFN
ncbi:MAG: hypothetical protein ACXWL2_04420 [Candidatus Chromulinivorax sp.]